VKTRWEINRLPGKGGRKMNLAYRLCRLRCGSASHFRSGFINRWARP